jgi:hypothetical protein
MNALAGQRAIVVLEDSQGVNLPDCRTALRMLAEEIRGRGVDAVRPDYAAVQSSEEIRKLVTEQQAERVFALSLNPLGQRLIVGLRLLDSGLNPLESRTISSGGIEELEFLIPRLVNAVINDKPLKETALVDNLSTSEGRKWEKKHGEFLWGVGLLVGGNAHDNSTATYGPDLRISYEMEHWRLDASVGGMFNDEDGDDGSFRLGVGGSYLFSKKSWSPYIGAQIAYMHVDVGRQSYDHYDYPDISGSGMGLDLHAGIEFFRLHGARMLVEVGVMLPFFMAEEDEWYGYENGNSGQNEYIPVGYGCLAITW